ARSFLCFAWPRGRSTMSYSLNRCRLSSRWLPWVQLSCFSGVPCLIGIVYLLMHMANTGKLRTELHLSGADAVRSFIAQEERTSPDQWPPRCRSLLPGNSPVLATWTICL